MTDLTGRKPILCLDFDGVCHSYTSGWKGPAVIPDEPVPMLFEFLSEAVTVFEVAIFSSRSNQEGGLDAMKAWFRKHYEEWRLNNKQCHCSYCKDLMEHLKFPKEKPPAFVGIDDRVITFTGMWPNIMDLKTFKPWNAKEV